ncbi:MAG: (NiFe) hydrogenase maturation protein HypF [Herbinix sp.]|jgi:hydrogenase maturation protein HypF|nr:(NiFe) hydrogenase maturation protein HypF [Herbinix sp.]
MDQRKNESIGKKIVVYGIVQGVGFRPLVYHIAQKYQIKGTVRNIGGMVEIIAEATKKNLDLFIMELDDLKNRGYEIIGIETENITVRSFKDFTILQSGDTNAVSIIPPDLPVCDECQKELYEGSDRRYLNPFISCMACGPRYTIINKLPYDRQNTTMDDFELCKACHREYITPESRRFHAQTISCHECGPYLRFDELTNQHAFDAAVNALQSERIIAVKGIGGYHYACVPTKNETVKKLRVLKGREEKPFAIMFETLSQIEEYCIVTKEEKELLEVKARPIVLLKLRNPNSFEEAIRGSIYCGAFLPYTPLQMMLLKSCGPLIMTSANLSAQPIIREDTQMLAVKSPYLEGVLWNDRRIERSVDDSVAKIVAGKPQIIRRSRGYVPYPVFLSPDGKNKKIFAAGSDLKAVFCLYQGGSAVISQPFGDLEEQSVFDEYQASITDLSNLLKFTPELAVCDLHPNYYSSKYAMSMGLELIYVQHHHAHIASVMAEHRIMGPVIGVAFDGTGYGTDGTVWGGEFLICEGADFIRAAHLSVTPMLGGDQSMKDAKKTADCFLIHYGLEQYCEDERSKVIAAAIQNQVNTIGSSSIGRLFDAAASILRIQDINRYEGECASLLEKEALLALISNKKPEDLDFSIKQKNEIIEIDPQPVLEALCHRRETKDIGALALGFHYAIARMIATICKHLSSKFQINTIALGGGVFQNTILTEETIRLLNEIDLCVYRNIMVPPNDGSISLGQTLIGIMR